MYPIGAKPTYYKEANMNEEKNESEHPTNPTIENSSEADKITEKPTEDRQLSTQTETRYVKPIQEINANDFYITIDKNKDYHEQAEDMAEAAATIAAVQDEKVRDGMVRRAGERLLEKTEREAAEARAARIDSNTQEQKSKNELYSSLLSIFNADKHYPEWLRRIVVGIFTLPYLILLLTVGIPTGIIRFTIECIDGIFVRYDSIEDARRPKVRIITWFLLALGILSAVLFPLLHHFSII